MILNILKKNTKFITIFNKIAFSSSPFLNYYGDYETEILKKRKNDFQNNEIENISLYNEGNLNKIVKEYESRLTLKPKGQKIFQNLLKNEMNLDEIIDEIYFLYFLLNPIQNYKKINEDLYEEIFLDFNRDVNILAQGEKVQLLLKLKKQITIVKDNYIKNLDLQIIIHLIIMIKDLKIEENVLINIIKKWNEQENLNNLIQISNISNEEMVYLSKYYLESSNKLLNQLILLLMEKKIEKFHLNNVYHLLKSFISFKIHKKDELINVTKKIEELILTKINDFEQDYEKLTFSERSLLKTPEFYFLLLGFLSRMLLFSPILINKIELQLVNLIYKNSFKTHLIAFNKLSVMYGGLLIYDQIKKNINEEGFYLEMKNYDQNYLIKFLSKICGIEMVNFWNSLKFETSDDFKFLTKKEFLSKKIQMYELIEKNSFKILEILLESINNYDLINEDEKLSLFRALTFLEKMDILKVLIKNKTKISIINNFLCAKNQLKPRKYDNVYQTIYNQFNADISNVLIKNKIKFESEYLFLNRFCDFFIQKNNLIIEIDGHHHFHSNDQNKEIFSNISRNVSILLMEKNLIEINFAQWEKFRISEKMEEYLIKKLDFLKNNHNVIFMA